MKRKEGIGSDKPSAALCPAIRDRILFAVARQAAAGSITAAKIYLEEYNAQPHEAGKSFLQQLREELQDE